MRPLAERSRRFAESVIRDMTRRAVEHGAVNLSQGFPDFDPPAPVQEAAIAAIRDGANQYANPWGWPPLRARLAEHYRTGLGWEVDPDQHVTVTCGVTEAIACAFIAVLDPGDEVLVIEPAHETYVPSAAFADAVAVPVRLEAPDWRLDPERLAAAVSPRTKAVLFNTPHNPTGRVFDGEELAALAELAERHDLVVVTDEIYDRILYDGRRHTHPGALDSLRERTITIGGLGKTYACTGWRLGHLVAPAPLAKGVRAAHDFLTICAPTPLQAAGAAALELPAAFYEQLTADYHERRALLLDALGKTGFRAHTPEGAYYLLADYRGAPARQAQLDTLAFSLWLTEEVGVAVVPGTVFWSAADGSDNADGADVVRFAFAKKRETLEEAARRLSAALG